MEMLDMMKRRRSIRRYRDERVARETLEMIAEAGIYAPNPGGKQAVKVVMLEDRALIERIGVVNANMENRNWGEGVGVSREQPSIIDDHSIKSGFYGCPALGIVCIPQKSKSTVNGVGAAFVAAQNMALEAYALGVSSCIVGRGEATFSAEELRALPGAWGLDDYIPLVFVCLGYIDGEYPSIKPRKDGRIIFPD